MRKKLTITFLGFLLLLGTTNLANAFDRIVLVEEGRIYRNGTAEEVITYQNIEKVYKTVVVVNKNPLSKKPNVLIVPEDKR